MRRLNFLKLARTARELKQKHQELFVVALRKKSGQKVKFRMLEHHYFATGPLKAINFPGIIHEMSPFCNLAKF